MRAITHNGTMHLDDVMAYAILKKIFPDITLERRVPIKEELDDPNVIVFDIGNEYNKDRMNFDHHQEETPYRQTPYGTIPYCAAGLIWKDLSHLVDFQLDGEENNDQLIQRIVKGVEIKLMQPIDWRDNGCGTGRPKEPFLQLADCISMMNPITPSPDDSMKAFLKATDIASSILDAAIAQSIFYNESYHVVQSGQLLDRVLVLDKYVSWQGHVTRRNDYDKILYVMYPNNRMRGWLVHQVPVEMKSWEGRCPFPKTWSALRGSTLGRAAGIKLPDNPSVFCHRKCFIAGANTKENAFKLAQAAIKEQTEWQENQWRKN